MNTRQLQYVIAVAEERSFSKAAERLHVSQPSLSQYIKNIEKSLEIDIFNRTVTPLELTVVGKEYLKTAYKMIALENDMLKFISDYHEKSVSRLNVGVSAYLNTREISLTLAEMRKSFPNLNINVHEHFSMVMDEMIEMGTLDFSISPIKDGYDMVKFNRDVVSRDRFCLAASREFLKRWVPELSNARSGDTVDIIKFAAVPFLTMAEMSLQTYSTNVVIEKSGFVPNIILRCRRWEMLLELVEGNVGVTLLTDRFLMGRPVKDDIVLFDINPTAPDLIGAVSYMRDMYMSKAARAFIGCYKRVVSERRDELGYLKS